MISSLVSIFSAGHTVSQLIGQKTASNWSVFDGGKYDLVFAPVGLTYAMLVIGEGISRGDYVLKTIEIFSEARRNIERSMRSQPSRKFPQSKSLRQPRCMEVSN